MGEKTWDGSYNIDVVIEPHSNFDNHLHLWNYACDVNQSVRDHLTKLFRHLINFNDGHCRSLDTIAGRFNPEIDARFSQWSWNEDWREYCNMNINDSSHIARDVRDLTGDGDDYDDYRHLIMVYITKINPCTIQESWQGKLIYRTTFKVNIWSAHERFGIMLPSSFENLCTQVIISPAKHSLQSLTMLKVIESKTLQEVEDVKKVWSTSFPYLLELMNRLAEFVNKPNDII